MSDPVATDTNTGTDAAALPAALGGVVDLVRGKLAG